MKSRILFLSGSLAAALLFNSCATNPVTGKKEVMLVSEGQELAMGQQSDPAVTAQFGLYPDQKLQNFINEKGKQMGAISHRPELAYNFRIVDSPVINAFAVPGGYVYFTRGIMAHFNNEAQFAGVLGHEIGHVTARHSAKQQTNAIIGQVGLVGAMIASPKLAQFGDQAMQGMQLLFLKFGRDDESQSDELGVQYSSKIGYDAAQMADFFQTLQREQEASGADPIPDFLSTHPNPADRYNRVHQLADQWKASNGNPTNLKINRDQYLRMIDGIVYGEDPKQGFVENNVFYHPELKFRFPVPAGWKHQNTPQQFQMADPGGKALQMLMLAPGNSLEEAAQALAKQFSLQPTDSKKTTINNFPALAFVADQVQQDQQTGQQVAGVRALTYLIQDGKTIFALIGVSAPTDFDGFAPQFTSVAQGFQRLTDSEKLNRQPERVRIKKLTLRSNLETALRRYNVPEKRLNEMAILNGMQLNDQVDAGSLIKVVEK
ncbi:M48 family metalloprotease [Hymenobacter lutimineralis]|uniref:M48 family metalloprotease n=1 Tax=Hymenobacter lutimineralis TaxID=2606448 RepID=A0A5D6UV65_9BACT|nr:MULTISPECIES: M48 family metalloprotease [Hymenobacter]QIX60471.1 M48 family metalloprotease [Hymenobacter sp. BT18]TYZ06552.1 M48 family metalloprotease [Hymenobacter lutimineralis]